MNLSSYTVYIFTVNARGYLNKLKDIVYFNYFIFDLCNTSSNKCFSIHWRHQLSIKMIYNELIGIFRKWYGLFVRIANILKYMLHKLQRISNICDFLKKNFHPFMIMTMSINDKKKAMKTHTVTMNSDYGYKFRPV